MRRSSGASLARPKAPEKKSVIKRFVGWAIGVALLTGSVLALLDWLLSGFSLSGAGSVLLAAIVLTVVQAVAWPFVYRFAARFHPLLFPVVSFFLSGLLIVLLSDLVTDSGVGRMHVDSIWVGMLVAAGLTVGSTLLGALFSLRDDIAYDRFVTRTLRSKYAGTPRSAAPGIFFLEIDGLAEPILRRAILDGRVPTLRRWLDEGSHRLIVWEPDLSSQTSASQAGILLGDNTDIPAFRWYDKAAGALMVSSSMTTARNLEHRLSSGNGLLRDGASRWNVFSGDAPDSLCTYSTFGRGLTK
jgi:uncharacterized membrane protein YvlD (DUF360 family)